MGPDVTTLTPGELDIMRKVKQAGGSLEDAQRALVANSQGMESPLISTEKPLSQRVKERGFSVSETAGDIGETLSGILGTWGEAGERIHTRITGGTVSESDTAYDPRSLGSTLWTGVEVGGDILRGVGRTFDELYLGAGKAVLPQALEDDYKDMFVDMVTSVVETGVAQDTIAMYQGLNPEAKNALDTVGGYVEGLLELVPAIAAGRLFSHVKKGNMTLGQVDNIGRFVDDVVPEGTLAKTVTKIDDVVPEGTAVREVGEEVVARARRGFDDFAETIADKKALAQELANKTPSYAEARRVGWTPQELSTVIEADDVTRQAMKDIQFISEGGPSIARTQRATDIAGKHMDDIYQTLETHRKSVGDSLGTAIKNLPDTTVDMQPAYNQIDDLLAQNGIVVRNGRFVEAPNYTDVQSKVIKEAYEKFKGADIMDATSVHAKDRVFGQLQREAYSMLDKQPVIVSTPRGDVDLVTLMRDVYRTPLDNISPEIRQLNKSYALARNAVDDISNTVRKVNKNLNIPVDQTAKTGSLLRRIDSRAVSADDFRAVADASYIRAKALGFDGADPVALIQFTDDIAPLYTTPAATPPTGFMGSIRGTLGKMTEAGAPSQANRARAISELLDSLDEVTPPKGMVESATKSAVVNEPVSSTKSTTQKIKDAILPGDTPNKEGGFVSLGGGRDTAKKVTGIKPSKTKYPNLTESAKMAVKRNVGDPKALELLRDWLEYPSKYPRGQVAGALDIIIGNK